MRDVLRAWVIGLNDTPKHVLLWYPLEMSLLPFQLWVMSGYKVLPEGGGYFDQDERLMADFAVLLGEYGRLYAEEQERKAAANGHP